MTLQVFRSLDRPSAFFGIRGRYLSIAAYAMIIDLVIAFFVGRGTNSLIGVLFFLALAAVIYLGIIYLQGMMSDKALFRRLSARRLPGYIHQHPQRVRTLLLKK